MGQDEAMGTSFLEVAIAELHRIKERADRAMAQIRDEAQLSWSPDRDSNSIDMIVRHLSGNMLSRWTDFLTTDGDKPGRDRDAEFEPAGPVTRERLLAEWEKGWRRLFDTLSTLSPADLVRTVTIRGTPLSVLQTIVQQTSHYANHVGQIIYLAKHLSGEGWQTLTAPRRRSSRP